MTSFCAICTDEHGPFTTTLHDGKHITACVACVEEHPRQGRYSFEGGKADRSKESGRFQPGTSSLSQQRRGR